MVNNRNTHLTFSVLSEDENGAKSCPDIIRPEGSRYSSYVWEHFGFVKDNRKVTFCKICSQSVSYKDSNTSGMSSHLKRKHPAIEQPKPEVSFRILLWPYVEIL